ncbi:ferritin-like protein [Variovorax sp. dw_308]|uniref:ferritin-like domain-containing protein n=1 Tax=Variovorax sp. dw_308 TaxID=2721546 RepID=UPI001C47A78D|nr:ferritin-like protein [Variovorax sp. dw_308]
MKTISAFVSEGIATVPELRDALQLAMQLEFSTIPPYLCAQWSIDTGADAGGIAGMIGRIVIQEMYHVALAGNMLSAIGGVPAIANADFIPAYPTNSLPGGIPQALAVDLKPLSNQPQDQSQLDVFLQIEKPEFPPVALLVAVAPSTIGAFYTTLSQAFGTVQNIPFNSNANFVVSGEAVAIRNLGDAQSAIARIKQEGEGLAGDPDEPQGVGTPFAHYYTFKEILKGRRLKKTNGAWSFDGDAIAYPAHIYDFAPSNTVPNPSLTFNRLLATLLTQLQACWTNGAPFDTGAMDDLRTEGTSLIQRGIRPQFVWADPV